MAIHMELERRLAAFKKTEAVVVFQSGFTANAGTVSAILGKEDVIVSDALNHASIIDGCRLSRAEIKIFPHKDLAAARRILQQLPAAQRKLLITDGVFSMDGDLGPLPELCSLAEEFGCVMMVDDAHTSGVFGETAAAPSITSTCMAGSTCKSGRCRRPSARLAATWRIAIAHRIPLPPRAAFLFSTSHPPSVAATCIGAIDIWRTNRN